jgi:hypothetical protein
MSEGAPSSVNLDTMSLEELNQLKQQEEGRQALMSRSQQLQAAAAWLSAIECASNALIL